MCETAICKVLLPEVVVGVGRSEESPNTVNTM